MFQDLRLSIRAIAQSKAATAVILLSLALGTGVNAAVYGVAAALLLGGPAGVKSPSRLVSIYTSEFSGAPYGRSSHPDYLAVRSGSGAFAFVAALDDNTVANVRLGESAQSARIAAVSADFFATLQMQPHTGRLLGAEEAQPAVIVSLALADQFGGAAAVLGQSVTIGSEVYAVAGVAPPRFRGLQAGRECDAWILLTTPSAARGDRHLSIIARLAPGVTLDDAAGLLERLSGDLAARYPATNRGRLEQVDAPRLITPVAYSQLDPDTAGQAFLIRLIVVGATSLLLVSACLNVGSLLLSRALARGRDLAVKMALGASRGRLVRQLLVETSCVSLAGGALGGLFAVWTATAIPALFMAAQAERLDTDLDARVMLLTVGVACLAGALFGVAPALHATAGGASTALRADAGGVSAPHAGARHRMLLVGAQVALSTVLLLAASLMMGSLKHALEGDRAAAAMQVAVVSLELPGRFGDPARGVASRDRLLERLPSVSGVAAVGWASTLPLGRGNRRLFRIGGPTAEVADITDLDSNVVSSGYFSAMALSCIDGRLFDERDTTLAPPVVVVDELLARRYFGTAAVGNQLVEAEGSSARIVGVVRSGRYRTLQQSPQPTVYYPSTQDYLWRGHLVVRTAGDPALRLPAIRRAVEDAGDADVLRASTLEAHLSETLPLDRLTTTLVGLCGLLALAMSAVGMYGVMSDSVQRRTREIGLRVALGAGRVQVARLVFLEAASLAIAGLLIGATGAAAAARLARHSFHGIPALDVVMLAPISGALAAVVAIAAILPLRRALRVHPNVALRAD